jgi:hypothetical protein
LARPFGVAAPFRCRLADKTALLSVNIKGYARRHLAKLRRLDAVGRFIGC